MSSKEDIRDNVIHYDDEGGGEEDTHAFDMGTLRNPKVVKENLYRRDVKPEIKRGPRQPVSQDSADIRDFINQRLKEHDVDNSAPPYDSLATYAYEGNGSVAESLSSIDSLAIDLEEDYDYLNEWGPRFKTLAGIFGEQTETQSDSTTSENTHWCYHRYVTWLVTHKDLPFGSFHVIYFPLSRSLFSIFCTTYYHARSQNCKKKQKNITKQTKKNNEGINGNMIRWAKQPFNYLSIECCFLSYIVFPLEEYAHTRRCCHFLEHP